MSIEYLQLLLGQMVDHSLLPHFFQMKHSDSLFCINRSLQEVHLDKHIKLLDSPGIIVPESSSILLRNCVKVSEGWDVVCSCTCICTCMLILCVQRAGQYIGPQAAYPLCGCPIYQTAAFPPNMFTTIWASCKYKAHWVAVGETVG